MAKEKLCVVLAEGRIPELGGILGPVSVPTKIARSSIIAMLNRGLPIYEVNPKNVNERVKLTFKNVNSVNFMTKVRKSEPVKSNPYVLPAGRRNTVVEQSSEATEVANEKAEKKNKNKSGVDIQVVNKSDF